MKNIHQEQTEFTMNASQQLPGWVKPTVERLSLKDALSGIPKVGSNDHSQSYS
jgi:hypothetical protein